MVVIGNQTIAGSTTYEGDLIVGDDLYISDGGKIGTTSGIDVNDDHISFSDTNREITFTIDDDEVA